MSLPGGYCSLPSGIVRILFGSGPVHLKLLLHFINDTVRALTDAACTHTHPSVAEI